MIRQTGISYDGLSGVEQFRWREARVVLSDTSCRGGDGTVAGAPDAPMLWDAIGENYRRVLEARESESVR